MQIFLRHPGPARRRRWLRHADRGSAAAARAGTLRRRHPSARRPCTRRSCAARWPMPGLPGIDKSAARGGAGRARGVDGRRSPPPSREPTASSVGLPSPSYRQQPRPSAAGRRRGGPCRRGGGDGRCRRRATRPRTRRRWSMSPTSRCPPSPIAATRWRLTRRPCTAAGRSQPARRARHGIRRRRGRRLPVHTASFGAESLRPSRRRPLDRGARRARPSRSGRRYC